MTRKSFRLWLASLLLGPACALALEIGEIQVSSALNQLFDAKIPLPSLAPEELAKVSVKLAAPPLFEEFGIDRAPVLANLVFSIQYDAEGEVYVKIVSTKPIREPSLALLLEFGWPRGKTIREFTIFLDPVQRLAKRPSDRTKTILDAQPGAMSGPAPEPVPEPPPVVVATVPLPVEMSVEPPLPVEKLPPPPPVKTWEPGATYGPVPPGEGLWAIALKLRPDPGISRDQMMQALFRANPQAFSKAGVGGLKTGAMLRIPTLREIADFTGSPVARRLAEAERPATSAMVGDARSSVTPAPTESAKAVAREPKAFPLAPSAAPEPVTVAAPPAMPPEVVRSEPESKPGPELVKTGPELAPPVPEPVVAALPEPETPKPVVSEPAVAVVAPPEPETPKPVVSEPVVAVVAPPEPETPKPVVSEPVREAASPDLPVSEPDARPVATVTEPSSQILEPVSATPLLFLAVSEMMAAVVQIPVIVIPEQPASPTSVVGLAPTEHVQETPTIGEVPPVAVAEPVPPVAVAEPVPSVAVAEPVPSVAVAEPIPPVAVAEPIPPVAVVEPVPPVAVAEPSSESVGSGQVPATGMPEPTAVSESAPPPGDVANLLATVEKQPPPEIDSSSQEPRVDEVSVPAQPVAESPSPISSKPEATELPAVVPAAPPVEPPPVESAKPAEPVYKGGDQYGPVSANERLWDIAGKVRPDPSIGKDLMMKALFAANPQAFSKPNMNSLKTGAMLRVPTLREIVDSTGSKAAKQLLDQGRAAEVRAVNPAEGDRISSPPPAPVETAEPVSSQAEVAAPDDALSESGIKVSGPAPDGIVASPAPTPPGDSKSVSGAEPTSNVPATGTSPAIEIPPASGTSPAN